MIRNGEDVQRTGHLLDDANGNGGESFGPNTYACRPPGTPHGFKDLKGFRAFLIRMDVK